MYDKYATHTTYTTLEVPICFSMSISLFISVPVSFCVDDCLYISIMFCSINMYNVYVYNYV